MINRLFKIFLVFIFLLTLYCHKRENRNPLDPEFSSKPQNASTTFWATPEHGGNARLSDGTELVIPPNALTEAVKITLESTKPFFNTDPNIPNATAMNAFSLSNFVSIEPNELEFQTPALLSIPVDSSLITLLNVNLADLAISTFKDTAWSTATDNRNISNKITGGILYGGISRVSFENSLQHIKLTDTDISYNDSTETIEFSGTISAPLHKLVSQEATHPFYFFSEQWTTVSLYQENGENDNLLETWKMFKLLHKNNLFDPIETSQVSLLHPFFASNLAYPLSDKLFMWNQAEVNKNAPWHAGVVSAHFMNATPELITIEQNNLIAEKAASFLSTVANRTSNTILPFYTVQNIDLEKPYYFKTDILYPAVDSDLFFSQLSDTFIPAVHFEFQPDLNAISLDFSDPVVAGESTPFSAQYNNLGKAGINSDFTVKLAFSLDEPDYEFTLTKYDTISEHISPLSTVLQQKFATILPTSGKYNADLTVGINHDGSFEIATESDKNNNTFNITFDVSGPNTKPAANFDYTINDNLTAIFDASSSSDNSKDLKTLWDFDSDGVFEITLEGDKTSLDIVEHQYPAPGNYDVTLLVIDADNISHTITKTITIKSGPVLTVDPTELVFVDSLSHQIFMIKNSGEQELDWSLSTDKTWITVDPTKGTTSDKTDTIAVSINRDNLAPGDYTANISITSNGGDKSVPVSMTIPEEPVLSVSHKQIDFKDYETHKSIFIENNGTGTLDWTIENDRSWLTLSPNKGATSTTQSELVLSINRTGLQAGEYGGNFFIVSDGGNETIHVTIKVAAVPVLNISHENINFGGDKTESSFTIKNIGTGSLEWTLQKNVQWLAVNPQNGSTADSTNIHLTLDRNDMPPGDYETRLVLQSNGGDANITVKATSLAFPGVQFNKTNFNFGDSLVTDKLEISNPGNGVLEWEIDNSNDWLSISPDSGSTLSETDIVTLQVNRDILRPGNYQEKFTVHTNIGSHNFFISVSVKAEPRLHIDTNELNFGETLEQVSFNLHNTGTGELTWEFLTEAAWVSIEPTSGSTFPDDPKSITIAVSRPEGYLPGVYESEIIINSNGGTITLPIQMKVPERPALFVDKQSLYFDESQISQSFNISNNGTGILDWAITATVDWITVDQNNGATAENTSQITVFIMRGELGPGTHNGTIMIDSNGGSATIGIEAVVSEKFKLIVNPSYLFFTTTDSLAVFKVKNSGSDLLEWNASANVQWLTLSTYSGQTTVETDTVSVFVDRINMEPGIYNGNIIISSNGGAENIPVQMAVPPIDHFITRPNRPVAPDSARVNESVEFTTSGAVSSKEHLLDYRFDWGDQTGYSSWGKPTQEHVYTSPGTYYVTAQARSALEIEVESNWSNSKIIVITVE